MYNLIPIEKNGQRVLTTQQLAESYETDDKKIRDNFTNNKSRYQEDKHYFKLEGEELKSFKNHNEIFGVVGNRASSVYLWTERGALLQAKSLNTDKAWEVYDKLVETYFRVKKLKTSFNQLSPQLQVLINMEVRQKEMESEIAATKEQISTIKDTIVNRNEDWRKDVNKKLRKIGFKHEKYDDFVTEGYELLESRARCNLKRRLGNYRDRLDKAGATKTAINKANYLDVISQDERLKEIYINIVNQLFVKHAA